MNTKVQINWDDINQNDYQYFNAIVREHSTYKEMLYLNEQNYHNIYLRKHFITFEGNKYFIPNPFVSLFFEKDHTIIPDFITNYKKGRKHFKKNYHKKAPDENYIERMKQLFNDEFKRILTGIKFIYNDEVGFKNGLLSAYIEFEEANYDLFTSTSKPKKAKKELHQFFSKIETKRKLDFLNELKTSFPTEKGKSIKAIIEILKENDVLIIGTSEFNNFYKELKDFFERDIGTYQSINDSRPDNAIKEIILENLKPLIDRYKQK